jgi:DNA invertase Pin-like site-specific DNA recombinase
MPKIEPVYVAHIARVSGKEQEDGTSIPNQHRLMDAYSAQQGYVVVARETEIESGEFVLARSKFNGFLRLAEAGQITRIIVTQPDRLGRGEAPGVLKYLARQAGAPIEYAVDQPDTKTLHGMIVQHGSNFVSGVERGLIRKRMSDGRNSRAREGRIIAGRTAKYGYRYVFTTDARGRRTDCKLEIDDATIGIYRMIAGWFLHEGSSLVGACKRLTKMGIATPSGKSRQWQPQSLHKILTSPVYRGAWEYGRNAWELVDTPEGGKGRITGQRSDAETITVPVPAAISVSEWQQLQECLKANKREFHGGSRGPHMMSGRLKCAACGYSMTGEYKRSGNGAMLPYYTCHRRRHDYITPCREGGIIRTNAIDEAVWFAVSQFVTRKDVAQAGHAKRRKGGAGNAYANAIKAEQRKIASAEKQLREMIRLRIGKDEAAPSMAVYREAEREIEATIAAARASIAAFEAQQLADQANAQRETSLAEMCAELATLMQSADVLQRRAILKRINLIATYRAGTRELTVECVFGNVALSI